MKHIRHGRTRLLSLSLLFLPACAAHLPRPPDVGPVSNAADLLHTVSARTEGLRDLEAKARITLRINGVRQKASAFLAYRSPNMLKFDIRGPLGAGILSALALNDSLYLYLPRDNHYLDGPPEEVLYRVTGVNLEYYDARRAILGLPNLSPLDLPRVARFEAEDKRFFLELHAPLWTRRLWLDRRTGTLLEEQIHTPQGGLLSARVMGDYRDENGVVLPRRIEIIQGDDRVRIEITRRQVNAGPSDDRFRMKLPSDVIRLNGGDEMQKKPGASAPGL